MIDLSGALPFAIIVALPFTWLGSMLIARKYKAEILSLMLSGESPKDDISEVLKNTPQEVRQTAATFSTLQAQNRRAQRKYWVAIVCLSIIISLLISLAVLRAAVPDEAFLFKRSTLVVLVYAWPMMPCLGMLARWSYLKTMGISLAYTACIFILLILNSTDSTSVTGLLVWLFGQMLPLFISLFLLLGPKFRTLGPYLLIVFFALVSLSLLSLTYLNQSLNDDQLDAWIIVLAEYSHVYVVFAFFILLPWLLTFLPMRAFARLASKAYARKAFSEPMYLISCIWFFVLLFQSISLSFDFGLLAYVLLLAALCIPFVFYLFSTYFLPKHRPPTLLLLRVFREDDGIGEIFDKVLERWRFSGNTVMIGGKDLAIRTLEPDELFNFLNGDLKYQFISGTARLRESIARLDFKPDPDGRFRVNEFFCFDTTWKPALNELVSEAEYVLMDLRDYHPGRRGCSYELNVLAGSSHLQKLVMVANSNTDVDTATKFLGKKAADTIWIHDDTGKARGIERQMLSALLS